nr:hypothetical protein Iba_chr10bCG9680 [Ipomoea batatas]
MPNIHFRHSHEPPSGRRKRRRELTRIHSLAPVASRGRENEGRRGGLAGYVSSPEAGSRASAVVRGGECTAICLPNRSSILPIAVEKQEPQTGMEEKRGKRRRYMEMLVTRFSVADRLGFPFWKLLFWAKTRLEDWVNILPTTSVDVTSRRNRGRKGEGAGKLPTPSKARRHITGNREERSPPMTIDQPRSCIVPREYSATEPRYRLTEEGLPPTSTASCCCMAERRWACRRAVPLPLSLEKETTPRAGEGEPTVANRCYVGGGRRSHEWELLDSTIVDRVRQPPPQLGFHRC